MSRRLLIGLLLAWGCAREAPPPLPPDPLAHPDPAERAQALLEIAADRELLAQRRDEVIRLMNEDPDLRVRRRAMVTLRRLGLEAAEPIGEAWLASAEWTTDEPAFGEREHFGHLAWTTLRTVCWEVCPTHCVFPVDPQIPVACYLPRPGTDYDARPLGEDGLPDPSGDPPPPRGRPAEP